MKQRPLHSELNEKSSCTQNLYNLAKAITDLNHANVTVSMVSADSKENSITTKLVLYVI